MFVVHSMFGHINFVYNSLPHSSVNFRDDFGAVDLYFPALSCTSDVGRQLCRDVAGVSTCVGKLLDGTLHVLHVRDVGDAESRAVT